MTARKSGKSSPNIDGSSRSDDLVLIFSSVYVCVCAVILHDVLGD